MSQKNSVSECFVQFLAGEFCSVQPFYEQRKLFPVIPETEITAQCVQTETNVQAFPSADVFNFLLNSLNVIMTVWETLATVGKSVISVLSVLHFEFSNTPLRWEDKIQYSLRVVGQLSWRKMGLVFKQNTIKLKVNSGFLVWVMTILT